MAEFEVLIRLPDSDPGARDARIEALYEAGCDDALIGCGRPGYLAAAFIREGIKEFAVASALADIGKAIPDAVVEKVEIVGCP